MLMGKDENQDIRVNLELENPLDKRVETLKQLFPEIFIDGDLNLGLLEEILGDKISTDSEQYMLSWTGRRDSIRQIQVPSVKTLRPDSSRSLDFESSKNIFIEGENLEVLHLLQLPYHNSVKMIYIDPPYNTGKDFVYADNFRNTKADYRRDSGQIDEHGLAFTINRNDSGSYHSKWMSMMYPRLALARNLLTDDGLIAVSIDHNEAANLKLMLNELYGVENHVTTITWRRTKNKSNISKHFSNVCDYIYIFARDKTKLSTNHIPSEGTGYNYEDKKGKYSRNTIYDKKRGRHKFSVTSPDGNILDGEWNITEEQYKELELLDLLHWPKQGKKKIPYKKKYFSETGGLSPPDNFWDAKRFGSNQEGSTELESLFGESNVFDFPKPLKLLQKLLEIGTNPGDLVMDFFAGSCGLAEAAMRIDSGARRFICITLDEKNIRNHSKYPKVSDIGIERIRLAVQNLRNNDKTQEGVRVFHLDLSNFKTWDKREAAMAGSDLSNWIDSSVDSRRPGRTNDDLIWELGLKSGCSLSDKFENIFVNGNEVVILKSIRLAICLDDNIQPGFSEEILNLPFRPTKVICLDNAFSGEDQAKMNMHLNFKEAGIIFNTV